MPAPKLVAVGLRPERAADLRLQMVAPVAKEPRASRATRKLAHVRTDCESIGPVGVY